MFWSLDKAVLKKHGSVLAPAFSCPATTQMNMSLLCLLYSSLSLRLSEHRLDTEGTFPGARPPSYIRLSENLIIMDSWFCVNRIRVMSFCLSSSRNSATCLCERLLLVCQWEVKHAGGFHTYRSKQQLLVQLQDRSQRKLGGSISTMLSHKVSLILYVVWVRKTELPVLLTAKKQKKGGQWWAEIWGSCSD